MFRDLLDSIIIFFSRKSRLSHNDEMLRKRRILSHPVTEIFIKLLLLSNFHFYKKIVLQYSSIKKRFLVFQNVVDEWGKKEDKDKNFESFHRAIHAAAFHERGKLKYKVNLLQSVRSSICYFRSFLCLL